MKYAVTHSRLPPRRVELARKSWRIQHPTVTDICVFGGERKERALYARVFVCVFRPEGMSPFPTNHSAN